MKISQLDTPALLVDLDKMNQNIETMQQRVNDLGLMLRPYQGT